MRAGPPNSYLEDRALDLTPQIALFENMALVQRHRISSPAAQSLTLLSQNLHLKAMDLCSPVLTSHLQAVALIEITDFTPFN